MMKKLDKLIDLLIADKSKHRGCIIELKNLFIKVSDPGANESVWECLNCHRVHLHESAGICSNCCGVVEKKEGVGCKDIIERNYYSKSMLENREPIRIHCEELSAQNRHRKTTRKTETF